MPTMINSLDRIAAALEGILSKMNAAALPAVTSQDAGKVLTVNDDGEWVAASPSDETPAEETPAEQAE